MVYNWVGFSVKSWSLWPNVYDWSHTQKWTSKGVPWTCCQNGFSWGGQNLWNVLFLLACSLPNRKPFEGGGGKKEGQLSRTFTAQGAPLVILGHFSEKIHLKKIQRYYNSWKPTPRYLLLLQNTSRGCSFSFGTWGMWDEFLKQGMGWQVVDSGAAPCTSDTREVRKVLQWWFSCQDFARPERVTGWSAGQVSVH